MTESDRSVTFYISWTYNWT